MKNALMAFRFLTLGERSPNIQPELVGSGTPYFPLIGLVLGVCLAVLNRALQSYLESEILAVVLVTFLILLTRAVHLAGTEKAFAASNSATGAGIYGLLAIFLIVLFKVRSIEVIGETRNLSLVLSPVFARWSAVLFFYRSTSPADAFIQRIVENVSAWHLVIATAITLGVGIILVGTTALWIGLSVSLFALLSRAYLRWRSVDISCNHFDALVELSETLSFVLFASLY
jgi:cobalamin synthase